MRVFIFDVCREVIDMDKPSEEWLENHTDMIEQFIDFVTDAKKAQIPCMAVFVADWLESWNEEAFMRVARKSEEMLLKCLSVSSIFGLTDEGMASSVMLLVTRPGDFMLEVTNDKDKYRYDKQSNVRN